MLTSRGPRKTNAINLRIDKKQDRLKETLQTIKHHKDMANNEHQQREMRISKKGKES